MLYCNNSPWGAKELLIDKDYGCVIPNNQEKILYKALLEVIDDKEKALTMMDSRLEEALIETGARLVVLDPIQGYLGADVDMHRANEIRPVMKRISTLAEKYRCAIVLIGHMNKASGGKSSYRGLGSIDFQAAARSVLIVGRIKDDPEIRVVCQVKSSLAPEAKPIAFRLDKQTGFEWTGEYDINVDDLLSGDCKRSEIKKCKGVLKGNFGRWTNGLQGY